MRRARIWIAGALAAAAAAASLAGRAPAAPPPPDAAAVDTLWIGGDARAIRELERWARRAELPDLVWLLRHTPAELGAAGPVLARAALDRAARGRTALRARLLARLGADPRLRRSDREAAARLAAGGVARPAASVFRVGALLPDSGDYADYARSVAAGIAAGLRSIPQPGGRRIDFEVQGTGDDAPERVAEALENASRSDGVLVGGLLSVPTQALATGARLLDLPLISPTATDEAIGTIGPGVFQIGPSGWRRGERLAHVMVDRPGLRVGVLMGSDPSRSPFALGFIAVAESLGASVEWKSEFNPGTSFRDEMRTLVSKKLDVLLWDGEPREAEALLREMGRHKASVRLCGGEGLAPDRLHAESRALLDGVRYIAEDWKLPAAERAALDSALRARNAGPITPLHVRGWLAGRTIARAVANGALCPEEIRDALRADCGPPPWLDVHHFLDADREGTTLPIYVVQRGRATQLPEPDAAQ